MQEPQRLFVYVGGWDWDAPSYPFRGYQLELQSGRWRPLSEPIDLGPNPSYIALARDDETLYVTNEVDGAAGGLTAARVALDDGTLRSLGHRSADKGFVYAAFDPLGRHLLAASYNGGHVAVYPIETGGALGASLTQHEFGSGAKSHSVLVPASGDFALVPNLGLDAVAQLEFDVDTGSVRANQVAAAYGDQNGSGPRTLVASPDPESRFVFLSHEFASTLSVLVLDENGTLSHRSTVSTLPAGFTGDNTGAHVAVHPNGRHVYASNRGHDSIAVFEIGSDGTLEPLQYAPCRGAMPRHFALDRFGRYLVAANQGSGTAAAFRVLADGRLEAFGELLEGLKEPTTVAVIAR